MEETGKPHSAQASRKKGAVPVSGADAMTESLRQEGVDTVFGIPGAAIAPFYDSLSRSGIRHILTRTEQGAGHAANGYARIKGRPGVCIATSGPGATNLFTALATAYSDSIPLVAITGQVDSGLLGRDVFQEVDTTGAAEPFTKYTYLVKSAGEIGRVFREAFHIASTGRMGPVLIDVPVDVQREMAAFRRPSAVAIRGYKPKTEGHPLQIRKVAQAIGRAKRPVLCCGGGILLSDARQEVLRLCEAVSMPVVTTLMGIGSVPPDHPLHLGMVGISGHRRANYAVEHSDLLIIVGARVGDRAIAAEKEPGEGRTVVHIDIDTAEIGKNLGTAIPIVGDAARVLCQLADIGPSGSWPDWLEELRRLPGQTAAPGADGPYVRPDAFVAMLCGKLPDDGIYIADVGQNQIWSARNYSGRGRFLTTGGMGTMGYSIPAALGAKLAAPDKTVVAACGDGAFQMTMNELASIRQHGAPVKLVVFRNRTLGLVREIQHVDYGAAGFAVDLTGSPDIGRIAAAYDIPHGRASGLAQAEALVEEMLGGDGPYILELDIDPEEMTV
ncbi:biosynthetic-type acetolactate synthase large subunit [Ruminococcaceae bacterium OttesenSCG-928-L11]|nr:biosynthetic-type acetolactate synthase large subunit [Ruminococcaceae bacterium OttesenSCG-928-L11]